MRGRRNKIPGQFVAILHHIMDSAVWEVMTGADIKVYCQAIRSSYKHPEGFSLSDVKLAHLMAHDTLVVARKRLVTIGLLKLVERGELCGFKKASKYHLSDEWRRLDPHYIKEVAGKCARTKPKKAVPPGRSNTVSENPTTDEHIQSTVEKAPDSLSDKGRVNSGVVGNSDNVGITQESK